jgi:predicted Rossmann-fold nucleotide-binding protein
MGGHKLLRASPEYRQVVLLALGLARKGFLICTGGGPGAMEAANLGGYLYNKSEEQIELALKLIASAGDIQPEYKDFGPPNAVLEALGQPEPSAPSLGIIPLI